MLLLSALVFGLLSLAARGAAVGPRQSDLEPATVVSALSIHARSHADLDADLDADLSASLSGRTVIRLLCGGSAHETKVELSSPLGWVFGICTLASSPVHRQLLADGSGQKLVFSAALPNVVGQIDLLLDSGSPDGDCVHHETRSLRALFVDLDPELAEIAATTVTNGSKPMVETYGVPYVVHPGRLTQLAGGKQEARFAENGVALPGGGAPGEDGRLTHEAPLGVPAAARTRVVSTSQHAAVEWGDPAACAEIPAFKAGPPSVRPRFAAEDPDAEGPFHTTFRNFIHAVIGGLRKTVLPFRRRPRQHVRLPRRDLALPADRLRLRVRFVLRTRHPRWERGTAPLRLELRSKHERIPGYPGGVRAVPATGSRSFPPRRPSVPNNGEFAS